jgi:protocadherin delta 1
MSSKCSSVFVAISMILLKVSICERVTVNYAIEEEKGTDYYLGRISTGAKLREFPGINSDAEFESLRYSLLTSGNIHAQYFTVNERTSDLYTSKTINRDELCRYSNDCILHFEVAADTSLSDFFKTISINVNILDINDNSPTFPTKTVNLQLSEATVLGTSAWKKGAEDKDYGIFSVQSYQLSPYGTPFAIDTQFYVDGRREVTLKVNKTLDRETNGSYTLTISAIDGGNPPKTGSVTINVKITDINDNTPKFSKSVYNITINEDLPENTVILRVNADDPDEGLSGNVKYKLSSRQSGDILRLFNINSQTGDIRITQSLTQEANKKFTIVVEATDQAVLPFSPLTSKAQVIVNVLDTQNTAPEVKLTPIQHKIDNEYVEYTEDSKIGTVVAIVIVTDFDSGYNGAVTCKLNDDHFNLESEGNNENDYKIVLGKTLDIEVKEWHEVVTTCSDTGSPPLSSSDYFRLHVVDINDNAPEFTQAVYSINVEENGLNSFSILQVHANDDDVTATQNVVYSLVLADEYKDMFSIDSTQGLIYVEQSLDREVYPKIIYTVIASDNVQPKPLTGTAIVEINVIDVNDNDPAFSPLEFHFTVPENQPPDLLVGRVTALDADTSLNGEINYAIMPTSSEPPPFRVMSNGTIFTSIYLDRETTPKYTFSVMASDKGTPTRSSTAVVIVNVLDENDNPPIFIFPGKETNDIAVSYQSLPNTVLATFQAHDPDTGFNTQILYYMNGSDILHSFALNSYTGQFSVTSQLDQSHIGTYELILIAADDGNQQTQRSVKLVIIDKATLNMSTESENKIKYFAIAVAISCVTVVLSILIVLAICLIKRKERQHHEKIAESVTTCSSLETDSEGSEIRFNEIYSRGILQKPNTNSMKTNDKYSNPIKKPFTTVVRINLFIIIKF